MRAVTKLKFHVAMFSMTMISLVVLLYGFEYVLSLIDVKRKLPQDGLIEGKHYTYGYLVLENRYGFRERDFTEPKPQGVYRIMVLGDSITWGIGLMAEQRYPSLLERYLNREFPSKQFEVLNFGLRGISTTVERDILHQYKDLVRPDLIIVGFCTNDTQPRFQNYSVERSLFESSHRKRLSAVSDLLSVAGLPYMRDHLRAAVYRAAELVGMIPTWQVALQRTYEKDSREWQDFIRALTDMKAMSDELGLPAPIFAVLNQGIYSDRLTNYADPDAELKRFLGWYHQAEQAAAQLGFRTYNFEQDMIAEFSQEIPAINVVDAHPSAKLHQVYAKRLFEVIAQDLRNRGGHDRDGFRRLSCSWPCQPING